MSVYNLTITFEQDVTLYAHIDTNIELRRHIIPAEPRNGPQQDKVCLKVKSLYPNRIVACILMYCYVICMLKTIAYIPCLFIKPVIKILYAGSPQESL